MVGLASEVIYYHSVLCSATIILFIGCHLLFGRLPERLLGSAYHSSRILMGISALVLVVDLAIVSILLPRDGDIHTSIAVSLTSYYAIMSFIALALVPLLFDRSFLSRRRVCCTLAGFVLYSLWIWLAVAFGSEVVKSTMLGCAVVLFLIYLSYYVSIFFRRYRRVSRYSENFYSEAVDLKWTARGVVYLVIMGLLGGVMVYANDSVKSVFMLYVLFVFAYIYARFINYTFYSEVVVAMSEVVEEDALHSHIACDDECAARNDTLREDVKRFIDLKVSRWIEDRNYTKSGISVQQMASNIGTNRTYLSSYINSEYGCTFRDWISDLRLDESRRLLLDVDKRSIAQIAQIVGFPSGASFARAFARKYKEPPTRWRERVVRAK